MHKPKRELVLSVISDNKGKKHLDEWMWIINDNLPKPKRMTRRCIANIMGGFEKIGKLKKEKINNSVFYEH